MARKPIHFELAGGKSQRQRIWEAIRAAGGRLFTQMEVTPRDVPDDTVRDYLRALELAEYLEKVEQGRAPGLRNKWKLLRDLGVEAPRINKQGVEVTQGHGNEAMWGAMQALGIFTAKVLTEMSGAKEHTVKSYCKALVKAGYLTVTREGNRHGIQTEYRLLKSRVNGPRPPMITSLKAVYDPNIHEIVWQQNEDDALEEMEGAK